MGEERIRSRNSNRARTICFDKHATCRNGKFFMTCHICDREFDCSISTWEAEHLVPWALGGKDAPDNLAPVHWECHKPKTQNDVREIAKGKRVMGKRLGIKRSKSPMLGSKRSGWRKRMDGTVERR